MVEIEEVGGRGSVVFLFLFFVCEKRGRSSEDLLHAYYDVITSSIVTHFFFFEAIFDEFFFCYWCLERSVL